MTFKQKEVDSLLVRCHRRCCICHKFCGFKMETHHIKPEGDGGSDEISNAIPLCFECHAEVAYYNPKHPKGRKYSENELSGHKEQWLNLCDNNPNILVSGTTNSDIGPLEGMILELEFNLEVARLAEGPNPTERIGCPLRTDQYEKSISEGAILLLSDDVKKKIIQAYLSIGRANNYILMFTNTRPEGTAYSNAQTNVFTSLRGNVEVIREALNDLANFLSSESKK